MTQKTLHIGIIAGETSGDLLAAGLIRELKKQYDGEIRFTGIGGDAMREEGVDTQEDMSLLSIIGLEGIVAALPNIIKARKKIFDFYTQNKIDLFIGIDAPDFNIYFETKLAKAGIPCVHYVSPTIWAWRYNRVKRLRRSVKHVMCLFPFEKEIYDKEKVPATFIGHPMADEISSQSWDKQEKRQALSLTQDTDTTFVGLLPGSRGKEVSWMTEDLLNTAAMVHKEWAKQGKKVHFILSVSREKYKQEVEGYIKQHGVSGIVTPVVGNSRNIIGASDFIIAKSGTVTLECMFINRPLIVIYKGKPLSAFLARRMIHLTEFAMPNILMKDSLIKEYFQEDVTPENMSEGLLRLMKNDHLQQHMQTAFAQKTAQLAINAHKQGAKAILQVIDSL